MRLKTGEQKSEDQNSPLAMIIARLTDRAAGGVRRDTRLDEDLMLDSLSRVELMSAIEDRYQIDLDEQAFVASYQVSF